MSKEENEELEIKVMVRDLHIAIIEKYNEELKKENKLLLVTLVLMGIAFSVSLFSNMEFFQ